jgi:hypothetical protein
MFLKLFIFRGGQREHQAAIFSSVLVQADILGSFWNFLKKR